jgi:hypothetical protein
MENAIKYTLKGDVVIDVTGDDTKVIISVADTGLGIPAEDQPHLFQKFYRVDNSDTREIGGTGLGLYLCRRLTETLGGRIWAESVYKQGSTFFVELPRIDTQEAQRLLAVQAQQENSSTPSASDAAPEQSFTLNSTPATPQPQPTPPAPQPAAPVAMPTPAPQPVSPTPIASTTPAPVQPQVPAPAPAAVNPAPQVQAPQQPQVQPVAPVERLNIPLAHIEQNPGIFIQQRTSTVAVPQRNQDNQSN